MAYSRCQRSYPIKAQVATIISSQTLIIVLAFPLYKKTHFEVVAKWPLIVVLNSGCKTEEPRNELKKLLLSDPTEEHSRGLHTQSLLARLANDEDCAKTVHDHTSYEFLDCRAESWLDSSGVSPGKRNTPPWRGKGAELSGP